MLGVSIYAVALLAYLPVEALAQSCSIAPKGNIKPSIASGYQYQVVATGLSRPRGIALDNDGNLLVAEAGRGLISAHKLSEENGCMHVVQSKNLTSNLTLNHGIEISSDGKTLYGSSTEAAYAWDYDSGSFGTSNQRTLVTNMTTEDHTTRTLLLSRKMPGLLLISRGSTSNIDYDASMLDSGHSQVRAFNLSAMNGTSYNFATDGIRLGWGLRNDAGVAEHPASGGIFTVENSADELQRMGVDIHQNNPAEEMNFLGYLNGTRYDRQGESFGYPWCFTAWDVKSLPNNTNLTVGSQFAIDQSPDSHNENKTDEYCAGQAPPRLSMQAHMAPLDMKFNNSGQEGWISFHGSWNRDSPVGYKLSYVSFTQGGEPVDPANSNTAVKDTFANSDNSKCPQDCFRPVAMAIDQQGRIFMSSDASGEVYLVSKAGTNSTSGTQTNTNMAGTLVSPFRVSFTGAWALLVTAASVMFIFTI